MYTYIYIYMYVYARPPSCCSAAAARSRAGGAASRACRPLWPVNAFRPAFGFELAECGVVFGVVARSVLACSSNAAINK